MMTISAIAAAEAIMLSCVAASRVRRVLELFTLASEIQIFGYRPGLGTLLSTSRRQYAGVCASNVQSLVGCLVVRISACQANMRTCVRLKGWPPASCALPDVRQKPCYWPTTSTDPHLPSPKEHAAVLRASHALHHEVSWTVIVYGACRKAWRAACRFRGWSKFSCATTLAVEHCWLDVWTAE